MTSAATFLKAPLQAQLVKYFLTNIFLKTKFKYRLDSGGNLACAFTAICHETSFKHVRRPISDAIHDDFYLRNAILHSKHCSFLQ